MDRQERICRRIIKRLGLVVAPRNVFIDSNRPAWQRNCKRPGRDKLLEAARSEGIRHIVVYYPDRLMRQPTDPQIPGYGGGLGSSPGPTGKINADVQLQMLGEEMLELSSFDDPQSVVAGSEGLGFRADPRRGNQDAGCRAFLLD